MFIFLFLYPIESVIKLIVQKIMTKILITGGTGFLGINLAKKLQSKFKVILGARNNKQNFYAKRVTKCQIVPLDVANIDSVRDAVNLIKPKIIIHAAATKFVDLSEKFPFECIDCNIVGSSNVARVAIDKNIETVIGISTDKASPPVKNIYGLSKSIMEKTFIASANNSKTNFLCVRYGNVAWSTGSVLPIWKEMYNKNKKIFTTGPYMRRFFFSVNEAVDLVSKSIKMRRKLNGKILSVEMKSAKIMDILKRWISNYGGKYVISKKRGGDRLDEFLIGEDELKYSYLLKDKKKNYFVIDFNVISKKPIKKIISSSNSKKLSNSEIDKILSFGMK